MMYQCKQLGHLARCQEMAVQVSGIRRLKELTPQEPVGLFSQMWNLLLGGLPTLMLLCGFNWRLFALFKQAVLFVHAIMLRIQKLLHCNITVG